MDLYSEHEIAAIKDNGGKWYQLEWGVSLFLIAIFLWLLLTAIICCNLS